MYFDTISGSYINANINLLYKLLLGYAID